MILFVTAASDLVTTAKTGIADDDQMMGRPVAGVTSYGYCRSSLLIS
jgi:hypothetical protein